MNPTPHMFCRNPWHWLDLTIQWVSYSNVQMAMCSLCWATQEAILGDGPIPVEQLPYLDFDTLWNAPRIQAIRQQWLDYLDDNANDIPPMCRGCPRLKAGSDPPLPIDKISDAHTLAIIRDRKLTVTGPRIVNLGYDPSCNLACPSCRAKHIHCGPGARLYDLLKAFQDRTVRSILRGCEWAFFSGYGDPFGSELYQELLYTLTPEECPDLKLVFLTNGLGFTPAAYGQIPLRERIRVVQFSIDAATEETYKALRGGSWTRLTRNLAFACRLRHEGKIERVEAGFVYQATNWREVPAFLRMCREMGVDKVMFYTLLNHAHGDGYNAHAIHHPDHPDHDIAMGVLRQAQNEGGIEVYVELPKESSLTA